MKKIIVVGASMHYGIGSAIGSWADIHRQKLLQASFGPDGAGERDQIYNLSVPGATSSNAIAYLRPFVEQLNAIAPKLESQIILSIGTNNTKAVDDPGNFISTPEEYVADMARLIEQSRSLASKVSVLGFTPIDESKTSPKTNPLTGGKSFYANNRIKLFEDALRKHCNQHGVDFIPLIHRATEWGWLDHLYEDGLHVKSEAQEWLYDLLVEENVL